MTEPQDNIETQVVFMKELPEPKMKEMLRYGDIIEELQKAYPDAFAIKNTSGRITIWINRRIALYRSTL